MLMSGDNLSRFILPSDACGSHLVLFRVVPVRFCRLITAPGRTGGNFRLFAIRPRTGNSESPSPMVLQMLDVLPTLGI